MQRSGVGRGLKIENHVPIYHCKSAHFSLIRPAFLRPPTRRPFGSRSLICISVICDNFRQRDQQLLSTSYQSSALNSVNSTNNFCQLHEQCTAKRNNRRRRLHKHVCVPVRVHDGRIRIGLRCTVSLWAGVGSVFVRRNA